MIETRLSKIVFTLLFVLFASESKSKELFSTYWEKQENSIKSEIAELLPLTRYKDGKMAYAGTAYNSADRAHSRCIIILGYLEIDDVMIDTDIYKDFIEARQDPEVVMRYVISLENKLFEGAKLLDLEIGNLKEIWNTDCYKKFGINSTVEIDNIDKVKRVYCDTKNKRINIIGVFEKSIFEEFLELSLNCRFMDVYLGSGGGNLIEAIKIGESIRARNMRTFLYGNCYSACTFAYVGGKERYFVNQQFLLGFHWPHYKGQKVPREHSIFKVVKNYLNEMGVSNDFFMRMMGLADPIDMYYPDTEVLCLYSIVNDVWHGCTSTYYGHSK
jgi:hypothetical protein